MFLSRLNCRVTWVKPWVNVEFIESSPAMVENCRSNGVATAAAMVSGTAPGRLAFTRMVGKSTLGRLFTGSMRKLIKPKMRMAAMLSVVMTGLLMNISVTFIGYRSLNADID